MINRLILFVFIAAVSFGCGDDPEKGSEMGGDCSSSVALTVDGNAVAFGEPLSATIVNLNFESGSELLVLWSENGNTLNLQAVINETDVACFPIGRIEMKDLPSNFSLLSFQYTEGFSTLASVSNVFLEDGGDGWLEIKSCDGEEDTLSVEFEFDAVTTAGDLVQIRSGAANDICFKRSK